MNDWANTLIVVVALANLMLLGASRLSLCVRATAAQGAAIGLFLLCTHTGGLTVDLVVLALLSIALKAFVFPGFLYRVLNRTDVRHELEPYVGYGLSILFGIAMLIIALWLGARMPVQELKDSRFILPVALWTIFVGLFIVVARRKAISQVIGYLALENGIFLFGAAIAGELPVVVEIGILLDVFVAVFVMGLAIFHINRELDHTDADRLSAMRD